MSPQKASSSGSSKRPKRASRRPARPSGGAARTARKSTTKAGSADGLSVVAEQFANRLIKPLDLVMLSRERIQQTLDEAAERGRVTRADANELASELFNLGRQQTETVLTEIERLLGRGRAQLESATKRARDPVERLVRRGAPSDPAVPVAGYDDLTARQVQERLDGLTPGELRKLREYERRHANRKSVLASIERALG